MKEGLTDIPNYGILLAEHAGFPQSIITEAKRISDAYDEGVGNAAFSVPN